MNHQCNNNQGGCQGHYYDYDKMINGSSKQVQNTSVTYYNNYGAAYYGNNSSIAAVTSSVANSYQYAGSFDVNSASQPQSNQWDSSSPPPAPAYHQQEEDYSQQQYYTSSPFLHDQTPPPEKDLMNYLVHQQQQQAHNDKYFNPYSNGGGDNFDILYNIPLSPISTQSTESFDNVPLLSPKSNGTTSNTVYCVNDVQLTSAEYVKHQYQLQQQYQVQQEQQQQQEYQNHADQHESLYDYKYDSQEAHENNRITIRQFPQQTNSSQLLNKNNNISGATRDKHQKLAVPALAATNNKVDTLTTPAAKLNTKHHHLAGARVRNKQKNPRKRRITLAQLQCPKCFKIFSRPYNLKSHLKTHTNERPFACLVPGCYWTFARPHDLKRHDISLHAGIKSYACNCGKRFARSDAFKRHQAVDSFCSSSGSRRRFEEHYV